MPLTRAWAAPGRWRRHALVLALAHLHVSKGPTGCSSRAHPLRLARSGIFFANLTKDTPGHLSRTPITARKVTRAPDRDSDLALGRLV